MANKSTSAKTRNPERDNNKAWSKNHNVVKVKPTPSPEKVAAREARRQVSAGGAHVTMPSITWEWATRTMAARYPNTRKVRSVDAYLAWQNAKPSPKVEESVPVVATGKKKGR